MIAFFWILASLGVAYWAKLEGRQWGYWFILALIVSPLGGSLALMAANRLGWRR
jgi:hypothetical protein